MSAARAALLPGLMLTATIAGCTHAPRDAIAGAPPAHASGITRDVGSVPPSTFVVLLGTDTLAVERYRRTPTTLSGELVGRHEGVVQEWTIRLAPGGGATAATSTVRRAGSPDGAAPLQEMSLAFRGDSVTVSAAGAHRTQTVPPGTLPFVNLSAGVLEQLLRQARTSGDSATVPFLPFGAPQAAQARVRRTTADSFVVDIAGVALRAQMDSTGSLLGADVPAQGVRFVRAEGAVELTAAPPPDYSPPIGAPYTAREVTVRNAAAGVSLAGMLTLPDGASAGGRVPAVVLVTGSGAQDRNSSTPALPGWAPFLQLADTLGRRGIAVLRLDDRGVGGSDAGPEGATTRDLAGDVRAALDFLRTVPEVDPSRLALLGHSEGALIVSMVAGEDRTVMAVVLVAAQAWPGRLVSDSQMMEVMREQGVPEGARDSLVAINARTRDSVAAGNPWMAFWLGYDPLPAARRIRQPVLIVQGETDHQVTPEQAGVLAAAIREGGNRDVTVRLFPDVNHLLVHDPAGVFSGYASLPSMKVEPVVLGAVADWLAARLGDG